MRQKNRRRIKTERHKDGGTGERGTELKLGAKTKILPMDGEISVDGQENRRTVK